MIINCYSIKMEKSACFEKNSDEDGIRTHACIAHWITAYWIAVQRLNHSATSSTIIFVIQYLYKFIDVKLGIKVFKIDFILVFSWEFHLIEKYSINSVFEYLDNFKGIKRFYWFWRQTKRLKLKIFRLINMILNRIQTLDLIGLRKLLNWTF